MAFKKKIWEKFEKFMDFGSNYWTDNYQDDEDYNKNRRNPGGGVGLALVTIVFPELVYLYQAKKNVAMGVTGIVLFVTGIILDLIFIYKPIQQKYPSEKKKVDRYNAFLEIVIFVAALLITILRYKLGLYFS